MTSCILAVAVAFWRLVNVGERCFTIRLINLQFTSEYWIAHLVEKYCRLSNKRPITQVVCFRLRAPAGPGFETLLPVDKRKLCVGFQAEF
jgi:hypothetical protein